MALTSLAKKTSNIYQFISRLTLHGRLNVKSLLWRQPVPAPPIWANHHHVHGSGK